MATTIDGFVAKKDGDSDWVSPIDTPNFQAAIKEYGCIIVGRKTFDQFQGDLYPVEGITNIVVTSQTANVSSSGNVRFVNGPVENILKYVRDMGHEKALLIGGGETNASFLKARAIDDLIVSVHPLILGQGISLFSGQEIENPLKLIAIKQLDGGLVQLRYTVDK